MKKHDFKKLALLGLMGGLLVGSQANAAEDDSNDSKSDVPENYFASAGCAHCGAHGKSTASRDNFVSDDSTSTTSMTTSTKTLTESELLPQLDPDTKAIYKGLDTDGKKLALELAATSKDKNEAVRAAKKLADRRANQPK